MPPALIILLSLALLPGCASSPPKPKAAALPAAKVEKKPAKPASPAPPRIAPVNSIVGRVALVNAALRYVVVDFSLGPRPVAGQSLNVYRQGQKVGEIRASNQAQENNIAADITAGEIRAGDEARVD